MRQQETKPQELWLVRDEQGGQYGPADAATLLAWARDGRLGPASKLSQDGREWAPAAHMPFLHLEWLAEIAPGRFYGPMHRDALQSLIEESELPANTPLFRRSSPATCQPAAMPAHDAPERPQEREHAAALAALRTELARVRESSATLAAQQRARSEALESALAARHAECEEYRQTLEEARTQGADLQARLTSASALEASLRAELADASRNVGELEARLQKAQASNSQLGAQLSSQQHEAQGLREALAAAQAEAARRLTRLGEAQRQVEELRVRTESLDSRAAAAREEAAQVRARLAALETEHQQTLGRLVALEHASEVLEPELLPPEPEPEPHKHHSPSADSFANMQGNGAPSLADVERQARLELERLGAQASTFFNKKRHG